MGRKKLKKGPENNLRKNSIHMADTVYVNRTFSLPKAMLDFSFNSKADVTTSCMPYMLKVKYI